MNRKVKIGVVGYGFSAKTFHLPFVSRMDEFEFVGISSSKPEEVQRDFPGVPVYASPQGLFAASEPEAVIITSPNLSHYPLCKEALAAGKHVILEKPVVVSAAEGEDLVRVAAKAGKQVIAFQSRRWDSDFLSLQDLLSSGRLGKISHFESHLDRYRPTVRDRWRESDEPGSGILFDLGSHLIDQALSLFGKPQGVQADIRIQRPGGKSVDYFHVILDYGRFPAILHGSSYVVGPQPRYQVHGTLASYVKPGIDPQEAQLKAGASPFEAGFGVEASEIAGRLYTPTDGDGYVEEVLPSRPGSYLEFFRAAAACIRGEGPNPVPLAAGVDAVKVILEAMESEEQRRPR